MIFDKSYKNRSMCFDHKSYGRIFVEKEEDIDKVRDIIKELDEFEYDYIPKDLITVFNPDPNKSKSSSYTHKFDDLPMDKVLITAWERGIKCFVVFGKIGEYDNL